jgi:hypothetical protein
MEIQFIGGAGVRSDEDVVVEMEGVAHGAVDAAFGGEAADHQSVDAQALQHGVKIGLVEAAVARLEHNWITRMRLGADELDTDRGRAAEAAVALRIAAHPAHALAPSLGVRRRVGL